MKTVRVVAAVIRDGDRIFATARGYGEYKGWWEFPGGKIEAGETPEEALVREIHEFLCVAIGMPTLGTHEKITWRWRHSVPDTSAGTMP